MTDQVKYSQKLKGQRALIIGGSSGIGYGITEALIEHGVQVTISSSSQSRIETSLSSLRSAYPSSASAIRGTTCDLGDEANLEPNIVALFDSLDGKIDHVIYTAADALATMPIEEVTLPKMQQAGLLRFFAPMLVAKHAVRYLHAGPRSSITFTTGSVAEKPLPGWSVIGSLATAITGMTRGLALDLKPIRVNCVAPGVVDTNLWTDEQKKEMFPSIESSLPTGKVARVSDIAEAYLYLIRDENVNGSMISTNGGALLV